MLEYLPELLKGLHTSLTLTVASIAVALVLALVFTIILTLKTPFVVWLVRGYITLFTGTPLLVQIFLIYYGPGQFPTLQEYPLLWHLLSEPWLCALIALSLNSAAYTTQLFYGAIRAIPEGQWQSCGALGMSKKDTLAILLPYAFKRALSSYSNEVVLVFKKYLAGLYHHLDGSHGVQSVALWSYLRCGGIWRGRRNLPGRQRSIDADDAFD
ncbi:arginine transporter permease ArtM [Salmonella enterica subsp. enterica]|nr:arginine transporter permease ArtM [Salmonella enterica subsp. enterica] [Salmonella enterica subsp. enterica serovar Menston]